MGCTVSHRSAICSSFMVDSSCFMVAKHVHNNKEVVKQRSKKKSIISLNTSRTSESTFIEGSVGLGTSGSSGFRGKQALDWKNGQNHLKNTEKENNTKDLHTKLKNPKMSALTKELEENITDMSGFSVISNTEEMIRTGHNHSSSNSSEFYTKLSEETITIYCVDTNCNISGDESSMDISMKEISVFTHSRTGTPQLDFVGSDGSVAVAMHQGFFNDFGDDLDDDFYF